MGHQLQQGTKARNMRTKALAMNRTKKTKSFLLVRKRQRFCLLPMFQYELYVALTLLLTSWTSRHYGSNFNKKDAKDNAPLNYHQSRTAFRNNAWFSIILLLHLCSLKFQGYFLARRFATSAASRAFTLTSLFPTRKHQNSKIHYQLKQGKRRNATINIQHLFTEKATWSWYASS